MTNYDNRPDATYETEIAKAVVSLVIDQTSEDGLYGVVDMERAIDGMVKGIAFLCANCGHTRTQRDRREIVERVRKQLIRELALADAALDEMGWARATPIMVN